MDIPRSNIRNYRPKQEAANLLMVLEQIAAWRAKHGEQLAQDPVATAQADGPGRD